MSCTRDAKLRPFLPDDLDAVRNVILSTIDACYPAVYPPRAIEFFKQYHSDANILDRAQRGYTIVAESGGQVMATGSLLADHISAVFVLPSAQRQGLGRRIMEHLEQTARAAGFETITLDVSLPSRPFYERLGYGLSHAAHHDVGEGQRLDYWTATKRLIAGDWHGARPPE